MTSLNIAQRMLAVNKSLGWIEKAGVNKAQGYDFVRAVDVFDGARNALAENGVLWSFSTRDYDIFEVAGKVWHKMVGDYSFTNVDKPDEVITGTVVGSACPPGDKGAWVVTTGMLKYALIEALLLPTGDDPENDGAEPVVKPASATPAGNRDTSKPKTETAATTGLTDKQKALLHARFRDLGIVEKASKQHILVKLTGKHATAQMSTADLDTFIEFFKEKTDATEALVIEAMAAA